VKDVICLYYIFTFGFATLFLIEEARTKYPPTLLPIVEDYHDLVTLPTCAIHEESCRAEKYN
jgi:hypothetical protein